MILLFCSYIFVSFLFEQIKIINLNFIIMSNKLLSFEKNITVQILERVKKCLEKDENGNFRSGENFILELDEMEFIALTKSIEKIKNKK